MPSFFSALNPISSNSGITYRATRHPYSEALQQQELPDLTLGLVIPFLWSRNLPLFEGIYESFNVIYGDHFDSKAQGFGRKGVLDFSFLPLVSRKLIADTYLKDSNCILNFIRWAIALPIEAIRLSVALVCMIPMIIVVSVVTFFRWLCCSCSSPNTPPPPPPSTSGFGGFPPPPPPPAAAAAALAYDDGPDRPMPMALTTRTAFAALFRTLHRLEAGGIRTTENIRRLLAHPDNLALVYAMEHLNPVVNEAYYPIDPQTLFDFLFANRRYWTDRRIIDNLDAIPVINEPFVTFANLQQVPVRGAASQINARQSTHTASVHSSTTKSALRLKDSYHNSPFPTTIPTLSNAAVLSVRSYDNKLVGQQSDDEILMSLNRTLNRLKTSQYTDPQSGISTPYLLQYCWEGLQDPVQLREGVTSDTAMACFYSALYEIDREYGIDDQGIDSGESGKLQACEGGAFNKLIEAMSKIHKLCEVQFINPALASLKLPCIVRQLAKKYINNNPDKIAQLKEEGLTAIWPHLQTDVLNAMEGDFSSIYPRNAGVVNPKLLALVQAGEYTDMNEELEALEIPSDGYQSASERKEENYSRGKTSLQTYSHYNRDPEGLRHSIEESSGLRMLACE